MDEHTGTGWFHDVNPDSLDGARDAIAEGSAESPADWPARAIQAGFATDEGDYYHKLHEATTSVARELVREREQSTDNQLIHMVRAMDDCERLANELAERVSDWAGSRFPERGTGVAYARELAERDPAETDEKAIVSLAEQAVALADEAEALRVDVERTTPEVAPNLSTLAGPVLAARLIALAGGLEPLAKKPSGTLQVLGAEEALFAHLRGDAPPPKHGVIYLHEYVRNTHEADRGSAARAVAGKLSIAARIDHYSGDHRPDLERELQERISRIRERGQDESGESDDEKDSNFGETST